MTALRQLALVAFIVLIVSAGCSRFGSSGRPSSAAFRNLSFEEALKKAKADEKLVVVDLGFEGCGACRKLEKDTWSDSRVQDWLNENTVAIKIDIDRVKHVHPKYDAERFPTILFLRPDGSEVDRMIGAVPPVEFLKRAKDFKRKAS